MESSPSHIGEPRVDGELDSRACLRRVIWRSRTQGGYAGSGFSPKQLKKSGEPNLISHWPIQIPAASVFRRPRRVLQTRHNVRRLKAVANSLNSARTFTSPRSRNLRAPSCSLRMPKMGSINPFRRAYKLRALSVVIQCRCWRSRSSWGPIHNALPVWASLVQTP